MTIPPEITIALISLVVVLIGVLGLLVKAWGKLAQVKVDQAATDENREAADVKNQQFVTDRLEKIESLHDQTQKELIATREDALNRKADYNLQLGELKGRLDQQSSIYTELTTNLSKRVSDLEIALALKSRDELDAQSNVDALKAQVAELQQRQTERHDAVNEAMAKAAATQQELAKVITERDAAKAALTAANATITDLEAQIVVLRIITPDPIAAPGVTQ